jgi:tetratricopeptide (TPR) repeat protein
MKKLFIFLIFFSHLFSSEISKPSISSLYKSIDPRSISKLLAFYELYPDSDQGKDALNKVLMLLNIDSKIESNVKMPKMNLDFFISLINHQENKLFQNMENEDLAFIEKISKNLKNRSLPGKNISSEDKTFKLKANEIDLARSLLISQMSDENQIKKYEICLDLMALQIKAKLPKNASDLEKIKSINDFIFYEMHFRFPPQSLHVKEIDNYTFLSNVIDNRRGVCLGISVLYLCLADRLDLTLQSVTPPGHIYLRYIDKNGQETNIETTARGIDVPTGMYLSIDTKELETRTKKEVIGLVFINQASVFWQQKKYKEAIKLYKKAMGYLEDKNSIKELLALNYIFIGKEKKAKKLLKETLKNESKYSISKNTLAEDYLNKKASAEAIEACFIQVDQTRESILQKQTKLKRIVKKHPKFRAGLFHLANSYLQLGKEKHALKILKKYDKIDNEDALINYYLSVLSMLRYDYQSAWSYYDMAKKITKKHNHNPKALQELYKTLQVRSPR